MTTPNPFPFDRALAESRSATFDEIVNRMTALLDGANDGDKDAADEYEARAGQLADMAHELAGSLAAALDHIDRLDNVIGRLHHGHAQVRKIARRMENERDEARRALDEATAPKADDFDGWLYDSAHRTLDEQLARFSELAEARPDAEVDMRRNNRNSSGMFEVWIRPFEDEQEDDEADNGLHAEESINPPGTWEVQDADDDVVASGFPTLAAAEKFVETH